jgi:hypothetical protein
MKTQLLATCIAILAGISSVVALADEIGRHELNGRTIIIDSNGTWKYAEANAVSNGECTDGNVIASQKLRLSVCVKSPWRMDNSGSGTFGFQFDNSVSEIYGGAITEKTELPVEALEYGILKNAADAMGLRNEDVPVLKKSKVTLNNVEWNYIEYEIKLKGASFRFGNYYISLGETGVAQVAFWCGRAHFENNRKQIEEMASTIEVSSKPLE